MSSKVEDSGVVCNRGKTMKPFSFVHVADLHLGYVEYNLDVRREDFNAAFQEVVDKTIELKLNLLCIIRLP